MSTPNLNKSKFLHYAWVILFVTMVVNFAINTIFSYTSSIFLPHIMEEFQAGAGTVQLRFTVHSLVVIVMIPFIGKLYEKFSFKWLLVLGIVCYDCAFIGFSYCNNVYQYIALGAIQGVGSALALFIPNTYMINAWFKKLNGLALALTTASCSLVATFTTPWVQNLVTNEGWRSTYRICGVLCMAVSIPVVILLCVSTPEAKGMKPFGYEEKEEQDSAKTNSIRGVRANAARKHPAIWCFFMIAIIVQVYATIMRYFSPILMGYGLTAEQAAQCLSVYSMGATISGVLVGIAFDKFGAKISSYVFIIINIASLVLLMFSKGSMALCMVGCFLYAFSGLSYTQNLCTKEVFGMLDYPAIFSTITIGSNVALLGVTSLFGYIYDLTGSYNALMISTIVCLIIAYVLTAIIYKTKDSLQWEEKALDTK